MISAAPSAQYTPGDSPRYGWCLALILLLAFGIRWVVWSQTGDLGLTIVDERHYSELASSLYRGQGFSWSNGTATSIRPPLYPFFVSVVWAAVGDTSIQAVRFVQILLSLVTITLVFALGCRAYGKSVGLGAAALYGAYPTLIAYDSLLLTEGVFNLFVVAAALSFFVFYQTRHARYIFLTGLFIGFAALTRSAAWPFMLPLFGLAIVYGGQGPRRALAGALLVVGFAVVVGPWSVRNTQLQGIPVLVDTMGGLNLYMGNYEHTPLNRAWAAVSVRGTKYWAYQMLAEHPEAQGNWNEAQREAWAKRAAVRYMAANPWQTLHRSMIKFANFWGLEREILAGFQKGNFSASPVLIAALAASSVIAYVLCAGLGLAGGLMVVPRAPGLIWFAALFTLTLVAIHSLVFGHSRYHLPLVPFLAIYAAAFVNTRVWQTFSIRRPAWLFTLCIWLLLIGFWAREVFLIDASRILNLIP